jgi:hypothetical protein
MRGDSIRDFYAKTFALLGLGVLAGTGALVDYWPSGVALPAVETGLAAPQAARSLPVPAVFPDFQPRVIRTSAPRESRPAPLVARAAPEVAPRLPAVPAASMWDAVAIQAVSLSRPSVMMPVETVALVADDLRFGEEVMLSAPTMTRASSTLALATSPVELAEDDRHDGLLTGAVKRTGSSIAWTGRKTGASIVEALRAVGSAFRRALPN